MVAPAAAAATYADDVQPVGATRVDGCERQRRLARERDPEALGADDQEHDCVAIGREQMVKFVVAEQGCERHRVSAALGREPTRPE